ncbi:sugar phosphate isomerase/epimerase [bacterium]|nr:sugar phosphate isomerase/epimerase [bacterium]
MTDQAQIRRRRFMTLSAAGFACSSLMHSFGNSVLAESKPENQPWLRKTLKVGMIRSKGSLTDKFNMAKEAGFEGVELNVPGIDIEAAKKAAKETGIIIDGTVGGYHWGQRHTDPDPKVREVALEKLKQGLIQTAAVGGKTMLLVPGHGKDGSDAEVMERAQEAIRAALPVAKEQGVSILIENVWNDFCYDHEGGNDQSADRLAAFIDSFDSPLVGVQYDIGNHWKYGDPAEWVRTLNKRIKKLDTKGFSREQGKFTKITEGDINWPSVEKALRDVGFTGWLAAEVSGGDLERLKEVSAHMDESLNCNKSIAGVG